MKRNFIPLFLTALFLLFLSSCNQNQSKQTSARTASFDADWKFYKGNPSDAQSPNFDDSAWRLLDLPHDWSIEDLPGQIPDSVVGPFSKASISKMGTGYTIGGTAWYRKHFSTEKSDQGKTVYLNFDGVYMNADVWVNGKHVGNHPYGYTSFYYDITSFLNPAGQKNLVAVHVKNEGHNARWYSGSGIYRHTWITSVDPVHVGMWGVFVKTPNVSKEKADISITANLKNSGDKLQQVKALVEIINAEKNIVGKAETQVDIAPNSEQNLNLNLSIENPELWNLDHPKLYTARVTLSENNKVTDVSTSKFGVRSIEFSAEKGFLLNGQSVELVGGCFHHDNGLLGSKAINRAEERKMELFKQAGYNAIRCSHNPPSPYLLDVCDSLGILVINEMFDNWEEPKVSKEDYSIFFKSQWKNDIQNWILRDRNHPSVIMWSIGNEIHEALDTAGYRIAKNLTDAVRKLDQTRAVTEGFNDFSRMRGLKSRWHDSASHLALLDVVGYNYMYDRYAEDHEKYPNRVMVATEFGPVKSLANWKAVENFTYVIGNFAWVVMDYLGEAGVGVSRIVPDEPVKKGGFFGGGFFSRDSWPVFNDFQGDIDLIGNKKPRYYHQLVVWRKSPVEMMVHEPIPAGMKENVSQWGWPNERKSWNWEGNEGKTMSVNVYTRSPLVKLELNGKIVGEQTVDSETSITATFKVPYEPGTLIARVFDKAGKETGTTTLKTLGKPAAVRLVADRSSIKANRNDLSYVMAEIIDSEGNVLPNADNISVNFELTGNAEIAGVGSGNPADMASFQQPQRRTWHGRCLAIVRPKTNKPEKVSLKASVEGLSSGSIEISMQ